MSCVVVHAEPADAAGVVVVPANEIRIAGFADAEELDAQGAGVSSRREGRPRSR